MHNLWESVQHDVVNGHKNGVKIQVPVADVGTVDLYLQARYYNPATDKSEKYNDGDAYGADTDNCASGAYIFKPKSGDQYSK